MDEGIFTRTFETESKHKKLTLYQKQIGEVSDAALVLAKYLDVLTQRDNDWLSGQKVLELGSGVGCVGMVAACFGAEVMLTDLKSALPMLEKNVSMNENQWKDAGGSVQTEVLDWRDDTKLDFDPDLILLADCIYYSESIDPLVETLERFCKSGGKNYALLCQELRDTPVQSKV